MRILAFLKSLQELQEAPAVQSGKSDEKYRVGCHSGLKRGPFGPRAKRKPGKIHLPNNKRKPITYARATKISVRNDTDHAISVSFHCTLGHSIKLSSAAAGGNDFRFLCVREVRDPVVNATVKVQQEMTRNIIEWV